MDVSLTSFQLAPWAQTVHARDGVSITRDVVALHGLPLVVVRYSLETSSPGTRLLFRPLLSGRDFHALHHENGGFDFTARQDGERTSWKPYGPVDGVLCLSNAAYAHSPEWYRNFQYDAERRRGLDFTEDLASPGVLEGAPGERTVVFVLAADTPEVRAFLGRKSALEVANAVLASEQGRRAAFRSPLERAGDAYLVKRGAGKTVIAGYPWFGDWGRDTFIALRGLCLATGRLAEARDILLAWAPAVSHGMLPNRFADRADESPEYNSVDAALWYVVCAGELLAAEDTVVSPADRAELARAVAAIIEGHLRGTRHGIRVDTDGLLAAGAPGVQLTWMDAKIGDHVVTPRIGKPVEIQALWINALAVADRLIGGYGALQRRAADAVEARFWNADDECLYDVIDDDHEPGAVDAAIRPNQLFAVGGLPLTVLSPARCRAVLDVVERELVTNVGLRSLSPKDPAYAPRYEGGVFQRDSAYHQGTVWPWLAGPFIEAWVKSRGGTREAKLVARERFYEPLLASLGVAGAGHAPEVLDGDAPHAAGGCFFQAWSVSELLRLERVVLAADTPT